MRWLDKIINSLHMNLGKLWEMMLDREVCNPWGHKQMDTTERLSTHKDTRTHTPYFCFSRNSSDFTAVIKIVRELGGLRQKTM